MKQIITNTMTTLEDLRTHGGWSSFRKAMPCSGDGLHIAQEVYDQDHPEVNIGI